jgi:hypothetical protein
VLIKQGGYVGVRGCLVISNAVRVFYYLLKSMVKVLFKTAQNLPCFFKIQIYSFKTKEILDRGRVKGVE